MKEPFVIAGHRYDYIDSVIVYLDDEQGHSGRAETCGVDYHGETAETLCRDIERSRKAIEGGLTPDQLQQLLPAGGARNGLDCALWDLACSRSGRSVWEEASIEPATSVTTVYTIGITQPHQAAELALQYENYPNLKIKADSSGSLETIARVRSVRPDARIVIDANQSWTWPQFVEFEPQLVDLDIALAEQPLAVGQDQGLLDYDGSLAIAADESVQTSADLPGLVGKYDVVNIKLDKTGGLTEALLLARGAIDLGFELMVGNMCGSSLAMAPAYVIAQLCEYVDLDGPLLQSQDVTPGLRYTNAGILPSSSGQLWAGL
jgi:L-Ala-D/L-Glu epimerase